MASKLSIRQHLNPQINGLYRKGMCFGDISDHIQQMYNVDISHVILSEIAKRGIPQVKKRQNRPLEGLYTIVRLDVMNYKVRDGSRVVSRAGCNVLWGQSVRIQGVYWHVRVRSEGSNFGLSVLIDLKSRGATIF
jgi:putative transposase